MVPARVVVGVILVLVGLLVLVVVVGLLRNQLDTSGLALILTPVISGLVLGVGIKHGPSNNGDKK